MLLTSTATTPKVKARMAQIDDSKNSGGATPDTVMTVQEAGRLGGIAARNLMLAKDPDYYRKIGAKGGKKTRDTHDANHYTNIGKKGGDAIKAAGTDYVEMGKKGAAKLKALIAAGKLAQGDA